MVHQRDRLIGTAGKPNNVLMAEVRIRGEVNYVAPFGHYPLPRGHLTTPWPHGETSPRHGPVERQATGISYRGIPYRRKLTRSLQTAKRMRPTPAR